MSTIPQAARNTERSPTEVAFTSITKHLWLFETDLLGLKLSLDRFFYPVNLPYENCYRSGKYYGNYTTFRMFLDNLNLNCPLDLMC